MATFSEQNTPALGFLAGLASGFSPSYIRSANKIKDDKARVEAQKRNIEFAMNKLAKSHEYRSEEQGAQREFTGEQNRLSREQRANLAGESNQLRRYLADEANKIKKLEIPNINRLRGAQAGYYDRMPQAYGAFKYGYSYGSGGNKKRYKDPTMQALYDTIESREKNIIKKPVSNVLGTKTLLEPNVKQENENIARAYEILGRVEKNNGNWDVLDPEDLDFLRNTINFRIPLNKQEIRATLKANRGMYKPQPKQEPNVFQKAWSNF